MNTNQSQQTHQQEPDHYCDYDFVFTSPATPSSSHTETHQTLSQICKICGADKKNQTYHQKTQHRPAHFIALALTDEHQLLLSYEIISPQNVCRIHQPFTCQWKHHVPKLFQPLDKTQFLHLYVSQIRDTACQCKSCHFLKAYLDFTDED